MTPEDSMYRRTPAVETYLQGRRMKKGNLFVMIGDGGHAFVKSEGQNTTFPETVPVDPLATKLKNAVPFILIRKGDKLDEEKAKRYFFPKELKLLNTPDNNNFGKVIAYYGLRVTEEDGLLTLKMSREEIQSYLDAVVTIKGPRFLSAAIVSEIGIGIEEADKPINEEAPLKRSVNFFLAAAFTKEAVELQIQLDEEFYNS